MRNKAGLYYLLDDYLMLQLFCLMHMCAFVTGIRRSPPKERSKLSWDRRTMKYYSCGFLGLIKLMCERGVIPSKEMLELKDYVLNRGYFDIQSIEYLEILDAVKMNPPVVG